MDRHAFDKFVYGEAAAAGVEFKFNTRFVGYEKTDGGVKVKTTNGEFETKILVGADGPNSSVAKAANLKQPENQLFLIQVRAKAKYDAEVAELWFGSDVAPGNFAWVVPESETVARVGLMTNDHPRAFFEKFFEKRNLPLQLRKSEYHTLAGLVPAADLDKEISAKLDAIVTTAKKARPRA